MDKEVKVVIGANYGDEGKGLVSGCLSREAKRHNRRVLNVFYNGGAQRAHTFNGTIHHCKGAGTDFGADTYYSKFYMVDPIAIWLEQAEVYINTDCRLVLPCDVVNNRKKEMDRGEERHGSCGMGIFEASYRSLHDPDNGITYGDTLKPWRMLYDKVIEIEKKYGYPRDLVYNNDNLMRACQWMNCHCRMVRNDEEASLFKRYDTIIFEGGQGLMLDQIYYRPDNIHLTPSSPGVRNCVKTLRRIGVKPDIFYVSRSYLTRHGAGSIDNACDRENINPEIEDATNMPNPWQGNLRYGYLDQEALHKRIFCDAFELGDLDFDLNVVYTHLNYTKGKLTAPNGSLEDIKKYELYDHVYASDQKDHMEILM